VLHMAACRGPHEGPACMEQQVVFPWLSGDAAATRGCCAANRMLPCHTLAACAAYRVAPEVDCSSCSVAALNLLCCPVWLHPPCVLQAG
jgi:hypothetical protein